MENSAKRRNGLGMAEKLTLNKLVDSTGFADILATNEDRSGGGGVLGWSGTVRMRFEKNRPARLVWLVEIRL
jgi:hypothetical protein